MPSNGLSHPSGAEPNGWPKDVGIHAIEIYFPPYFVDQKDLEKFDSVSEGKYTIGLGQEAMGFTGDQEDVNSMSLTAVHNLLEKHNVEMADIGWMGVGTETIIDKSKSTKSVLMSIFASSGNSDVEGVDFKNACYGGTAALFSAIDWVESSSWDGRFALVVACDSAVYARGPARPTGGAGAVAILVGPHAPLIMERGLRASHVAHAFDFFKPDLKSEYPTVDGALSIQSYFTALDSCYRKYKQKFSSRRQSPVTSGGKGDAGVDIVNGVPLHDSSSSSSSSSSKFDLDSAQAFLFHTPFSKLVQKSLGRLLYNDFVIEVGSSYPPPPPPRYPELQPFANLSFAESIVNKDLEKALTKTSRTIFETKTEPSLFIAKKVGNMYTPSLYGGLASHLLGKSPSELSGSRLVLFSYGSGLASSLFSLRVSPASAAVGGPLDRLLRGLADIPQRLEARRKLTPTEFTDVLARREENYHAAPFMPKMPASDLAPGSYYLSRVDEMRRRFYERSLKEVVMCE